MTPDGLWAYNCAIDQDSTPSAIPREYTLCATLGKWTGPYHWTMTVLYLTVLRLDRKRKTGKHSRKRGSNQINQDLPAYAVFVY